MRKRWYGIALLIILMLFTLGPGFAAAEEDIPAANLPAVQTQEDPVANPDLNETLTRAKDDTADSGLPLGKMLQEELAYRLTERTAAALAQSGPVQPAQEAIPIVADGSSLTIRGLKVLNGRALKSAEFTFVLKDAEGNVLEEVQNSGNTFAFSPIRISEAGEYTYYVSEKDTALGGIEYDSSVYTVAVLAENSGAEALKLTAQCRKNAEAADSIVFANTYLAYGMAELTGVQLLDGRTAEADTFTYTVLEGDRTVATGKADANGKIAFTRLNYDLADIGIHTYTVTQDSREMPGYALDSGAYTVTVNVQDNADGTLQTVVTGDGGDLVFTNTYSAQAALSLEGRKLFEDEAEAKAFLGGGESLPAFAFTLSEVIDGEEQWLANALSSEKDGAIRFEPLQYTQNDAGIHTYVIREIDNGSELIAFDDTEYTVTVGVQDNGDGTLTLTKEIQSGAEDADEIVFTNAVNHTCLTIQKWVTGEIVDYAFRMTVILKLNGEELTGAFPYYGSREGTIASGGTIELKSGENITIGDLPEGVYYRVIEEECPRYRVIVNGQDTLVTEGTARGEEGALLEFTNSLISTTFTVYKQWVGVQGGKIRLIMYADGVEMVPQPSVSWSGGSNTYTVDGLPKYTFGGRRIIYTAKEAYMSGYMTDYRNLEGLKADCAYDGCTIVNTAVKAIRVRGVFSGVDPKESLPTVGLTVYRANGTEYKHVNVKADKNGWLNIYNLPLNTEYYVVQDPLEGFKTSYANAEGSKYAEETDRVYENGTITNHKIAKTGDDRPVALWTGTMAVSLAGMAVLVHGKRRVKNH